MVNYTKLSEGGNLHQGLGVRVIRGLQHYLAKPVQ